MEEIIEAPVFATDGDVVKIIPPRGVENRTGEQTLDATVSLIHDELVEVIQPLLREQTVKVVEDIPQVARGNSTR